MKENYKIIMDETVLDSFINFLPELRTTDEKFYVCLFARSKYLTEEQKGQMSHIKSDKAQLKRVVADKKSLKTKLKQMECPVGSYIQYKTNVPDNPVPQEALAVYITINPRSLGLATRNSLKKFVEMIADNPKDNFNPSNFAMSEIQRSKAKNPPYYVLDIDTKEINVTSLKENLSFHLGKTPFGIIETRGGYHILISLRNIDESRKKTWYYGLKDLFGDDLDQAGDIMIPIPGTYQGGHIPKFV